MTFTTRAPADERFYRGQSPFFRRLRLTLGVLILYRLGCHLPLPDINIVALANFGARTGLDFERVSIFGLGVIPLFSVLFIAELGKTLVPPLTRIVTPQNARFFRCFALGIALVFAALQGLGIANGLEGARVVDESGWAFRVECAATLAGATALLSWLAERVSLRGLANGVWLLLTASSLANLPGRAGNLLELTRQGAAGPGLLALITVAEVAAIGLLVAASRACHKTGPGEAPPPPPALEAVFAGLWPPLLGSVLAGYAMLAFALLIDHDINAIAKPMYGLGGGLHMAALVALIALFAWLRARGSPAPRPVWPLTLAQILVCVGGEWLTAWMGAPYEIGGVWLIVVTAVAMNALGIVSRAMAPAVEG